jgi:hypothetical protein
MFLDSLLQIFTVVKKHNVDLVRITCGLVSSVSEEYTACVFRRLSDDGGSMFLWNSIHTRLFGVGAEGHNFNAFWIKNEVMEWKADGVWYGMVVLGVYPISHSTEIRFLVVLNTTLILYILHFLTTLVAILGSVNY